MKKIDNIVIPIENNKLNELIELIHQNSGTCYIVGGYVRDFYLTNKLSDDIDIEVHNIDLNKLIKLVKHYFDVIVYDQFGVISVKAINTQFTIPRLDIKQGDTHRDFNIQLDPYLGEYNSTLRRDFTCNSLMYNCKENHVVDYHNGIKDIFNKKLVYLNYKFRDDPLRLMRAIRFTAQLDFETDESTSKILSEMIFDIKYLSSYRINQELKIYFSSTYFIKKIEYFQAYFLSYFLLPNSFFNHDSINKILLIFKSNEKKISHFDLEKNLMLKLIIIIIQLKGYIDNEQLIKCTFNRKSDLNKVIDVVIKLEKKTSYTIEDIINAI